MVGSPCSRAGISRNASRPRCSSAMATGSVRSVASKTALTTRCWFLRPSASSSPALRSTSRSAARSGRVTSTMVVRLPSPRASTAAANRASCIFSPEWGPRHEAPWVVDCRNPVQTRGKLRSRRVCPVGAVSNSTWSNGTVVSSPARSSANSSNAAISTVHAPASCSRSSPSLASVQMGAIGRDHALAVLVGRLLRIDVERGEPVHARDRRGSVRERNRRASRRGSTPGRC